MKSKQFFMLLIALIAVIGVSAQTVTYPTLQPLNTYAAINTSYTFSGDTARAFVFPAAQHYPSTQDYTIKIDSVSGNHTSVTVVLAGSKSALKNDWTTISTVVWTTVPIPSSDTTIVISNATANRYRFFRATVTGAGTGVSAVRNQELKLWLE